MFLYVTCPRSSFPCESAPGGQVLWCFRPPYGLAYRLTRWCGVACYYQCPVTSATESSCANGLISSGRTFWCWLIAFATKVFNNLNSKHEYTINDYFSKHCSNVQTNRLYMLGLTQLSRKNFWCYMNSGKQMKQIFWSLSRLFLDRCHYMGLASGRSLQNKP